MAEYRIPLDPTPQAFGITLAGRLLRMTVRWNDADEAGWVLDIADGESGADLLTGIPLVTGADLLEPHAHLGLGGSLVVWSDSSDLPPAIDNLGTAVDLIFVTQEAV